MILMFLGRSKMGPRFPVCFMVTSGSTCQDELKHFLLG